MYIWRASDELRRFGVDRRLWDGRHRATNSEVSVVRLRLEEVQSFSELLDGSLKSERGTEGSLGSHLNTFSHTPHIVRFHSTDGMWSRSECAV